jgi:hypothetical protein
MCAPEWSLSLALGVILYISPNNIRYISLFFFCSFRENKMSAVVIAYGVLWSNDRSLQSSKYESPSLSLSLVCWYILLRRHTHFFESASFLLYYYYFFFFHQKVRSLPAVCHLLGYSIVLNFLDGGRLKGRGLLFLRLKEGIYKQRHPPSAASDANTGRQGCGYYYSLGLI